MDAIAADLRALRNMLHESKEFRTIACHPRLTRAATGTGDETGCSAAAKFNPLMANFLALTAQNRRLKNLGGIIEAFLAELASKRGEYTADVLSAKRPLSAVQQEQLAVKLRELAGGKVHVSVREDASLMGGLVVKLGSRLIDASVKTKLARQAPIEITFTLSASQKGAA